MSTTSNTSRKSIFEDLAQDRLLSRPDLLLPVRSCKEEKRYRQMSDALFVLFDIPLHDSASTLLRNFLGRDLCHMPIFQKASNCNYYQFLLEKTKEREPILSLYSYLFENREPYYNESYYFTPEELIARSKYYEYLKERYPEPDDFKTYFNFILGDNNVVPFPRIYNMYSTCKD